MVTDKGIDALITILPALLRLARQVQIVLLGSTSDKEVRYEAALRYIESCYPEQLRLLMGFSPALAHHVYAGSDMMLVPSFFEPCGLIQMIAMRYGSVPIVRKTGGLADTVREEVNGFVFGETTRADWIAQSKNTLLQQISEADQRYVFTTYTNDQMLDAVLRALWVYRHYRFTWGCIQEQGMLTDFSWDKAAQPYLPMYVDAQKRLFREQYAYWRIGYAHRTIG